MKKIIAVLMCLIISLSFFSCSKDNEKQESLSSSTQSKNEEKEVNVQIDDSTNKKNKDEVLDLTKLSSTLVYSEVYNIMVNPDNYVGRTIKMQGKFSVYHDEKRDKNFYSCIIQDATVCCAQGMEFMLKGDYEYPKDYPKEGEEITVIGEFIRYSEGKHVYCGLKDAKLL